MDDATEEVLNWNLRWWWLVYTFYSQAIRYGSPNFIERNIKFDVIFDVFIEIFELKLFEQVKINVQCLF